MQRASLACGRAQETELFVVLNLQRIRQPVRADSGFTAVNPHAGIQRRFPVKNASARAHTLDFFLA